MDIPPATTPNPATIVYDEREELLREAAALGNSKAVLHYVQAGVNANARNKINGWTPLHWAASRGHSPIVHLLVRHGADPAVLNYKKQTALDLTKSGEVREFLEQRTPVAAPSTSNYNASDSLPAKSEDKVEDAVSKLSIKPNYLREPDLLKTWSSPDELPSQLKPTVLTEADRPMAAASTSSQPAPAASEIETTSSLLAQPVTSPQVPSQSTASRIIPLTSHSPTLIRIAINAVPKGGVSSTSPVSLIPANLIGHVLTSPVASLADLAQQIQDELLQDDNASAFAHLYHGKPTSGAARRLLRLVLRVPNSYFSLEGNETLVSLPRSQWAKYSVGEVVLAQVRDNGCPWAFLVAEIEV